MALKKVSIEASVGKSLVVDMQARGHKMVIDQPKAGGGTDQGPTPLEYFFFALGGCICTIARIVANQKRIDLRNVTCRVEGELNTDVLLGKSKDDRAGFQGIKVYTTVDADMTQEEKEAFIKEVDERCPISENIHNLTSVEIIVEG